MYRFSFVYGAYLFEFVSITNISLVNAVYCSKLVLFILCSNKENSFWQSKNRYILKIDCAYTTHYEKLNKMISHSKILSPLLQKMSSLKKKNVNILILKRYSLVFLMVSLSLYYARHSSLWHYKKILKVGNTHCSTNPIDFLPTPSSKIVFCSLPWIVIMWKSCVCKLIWILWVNKGIQSVILNIKLKLLLQLIFSLDLHNLLLFAT